MTKMLGSQDRPASADPGPPGAILLHVKPARHLRNTAGHAANDYEREEPLTLGLIHGKRRAQMQ